RVEFCLKLRDEIAIDQPIDDVGREDRVCRIEPDGDDARPMLRSDSEPAFELVNDPRLPRLVRLSGVRKPIGPQPDPAFEPIPQGVPSGLRVEFGKPVEAELGDRLASEITRPENLDLAPD